MGTHPHSQYTHGVGTIAAIVVAVGGLIAIILGAIQLKHYLDFRRPLVHPKDVDLPVSRKAGHALIGPGALLLNLRGARNPVTITKWEYMFFKPEGGGGGQGSEGPSFTLEPQVWRQFAIPIEGGLGLKGDPPASLYVEVYLSNPRDVFTGRMKLKLTDDCSKYYLDNLDEFIGHIYRTHWRKYRRRWFFRRLMGAMRALFPTRKDA